MKTSYKKLSALITEEMPPIDYEYDCVLVWSDGKESVSDGGTCWYIARDFLPAYRGWKKIIR